MRTEIAWMTTVKKLINQISSRENTAICSLQDKQLGVIDIKVEFNVGVPSNNVSRRIGV